MGAEDYEPVPLLDEEQQSEKRAWRHKLSLGAFYQTRPEQRAVQHWAWIGHAVLLSVSTTLFTLAFCMHSARPTDLTVTTQFSSYCKTSCFCCKRQRLTAAAPAAPVVKYDTVRYNLTPVMTGSPYVGKGPEVDEAWEQISRGKHHPSPPSPHSNTAQSET